MEISVFALTGRPAWKQRQEDRKSLARHLKVWFDRLSFSSRESTAEIVWFHVGSPHLFERDFLGLSLCDLQACTTFRLTVLMFLLSWLIILFNRLLFESKQFVSGWWLCSIGLHHFTTCCYCLVRHQLVKSFQPRISIDNQSDKPGQSLFSSYIVVMKSSGTHRQITPKSRSIDLPSWNRMPEPIPGTEQNQHQRNSQEI
jgi:hypothetical protein